MPAPSTFSVASLVRPNILALKPYRCARDDFSEGILLDANENAFGPAIADGSIAGLEGQDLERYPDPHQLEIKKALAEFRGIPSTDYFFLGVGSDESIDLLIRVTCVPGKDKILICPPTYGMYSVCAQINDVQVTSIPLDVEDGRFSIQNEKVKAALAADPSIKVVFLCSPGNPTGTLLSHADIKELLEFEKYNGVIVVDEAYIDFCPEGSSVANLIPSYSNLVVTQTLSKSFGLAGIRLGVTIATPELTAVFNKTKAPYNISSVTSMLGKAALSPSGIQKMKANVDLLNQQRSHLIATLSELPFAGRILGANHANFVVVQIVGNDGSPSNPLALKIYENLARVEGVVVRFRGNEIGCTGCLRITVGTPEENKVLMSKLRAMSI
ncbi:histidinol-phosphate transaminase [Dinochytrium kinnereticum]|nr:histidinol-phosphate transaminase [Dinochytrium kinnereticum]